MSKPTRRRKQQPKRGYLAIERYSRKRREFTRTKTRRVRDGDWIEHDQ